MAKVTFQFAGGRVGSATRSRMIAVWIGGHLRSPFLDVSVNVISLMHSDLHGCQPATEREREEEREREGEGEREKEGGGEEERERVCEYVKVREKWQD